jgi:hypothetical protein
MGLCEHFAVTIGGSVPDSQRLRAYKSGGPNNICIPRFRNISEPSSNFIRGYGMWGGLQRRVVNKDEEAFWSLTSILEVLPTSGNRITIDPHRVDAFGIKTANIEIRHEENEKNMMADALQAMNEMADAGGLKVRLQDVSRPGQYVHELGGAAMGSSRLNSVLNSYNQCWDAPNLFVVDGSCFVTAGWQNPSLTIMAIAVRACEHIVAKVRSGHI